MVQIWEGTSNKGTEGRILYDPQFISGKPYQLSVSSEFLPATGSFKTLRGAKGEAARYTGAKWVWKEVDVP